MAVPGAARGGDHLRLLPTGLRLVGPKLLEQPVSLFGKRPGVAGHTIGRRDSRRCGIRPPPAGGNSCRTVRRRIRRTPDRLARYVAAVGLCHSSAGDFYGRLLRGVSQLVLYGCGGTVRAPPDDRRRRVDGGPAGAADRTRRDIRFRGGLVCHLEGAARGVGFPACRDAAGMRIPLEAESRAGLERGSPGAAGGGGYAGFDGCVVPRTGDV